MLPEEPLDAGACPGLGLADPTFLPPFSDVFAAGWQLAQNGELYDDDAASLLRALSGFLISVALIVPLGLAVGWYARLGGHPAGGAPDDLCRHPSCERCCDAGAGRFRNGRGEGRSRPISSSTASTAS
jgi:hypothetical protein